MADAAVWLTGTGQDKQLNFRLPTGGKGDKGDKGDKGLDGANVLPTQQAIEQAIINDGPAKTAIEATVATLAPIKTVNGYSPDPTGNVVVPGGGGIVVSDDPNTPLAPGQILFLVESAWTPLNLPLAWWYDAQAITGLASGAPVTSLADRSGYARTLTQGTAATAPTYAATGINGRPALAFGGTAHLTSAAFTAIQGPLTIISVAKIDTLGASRTVVDGSTNSGRAGFGALSAGQWFATRANLLSGGTADTSLHLFTTILDGANSSFSVNGTQVFAGDAGTAAYPVGVRLGARWDGANGLVGSIGEIFMTQGRMSAADIAEATTYLTEKWGL